MIDRDIAFNLANRVGIAPQDASAGTVNGVGVDRGSNESCMLAPVLGAVSGSPSSFSVTVTLEHADTQGGSYTQFGTEEVVLDSADSAAKLGFNLSGAKKFVRASAAVAFTGGTTPSVLMSVPLVLANADELPNS